MIDKNLNPNLNPDLNPDLKKPEAPPAVEETKPIYDRDKFYDAVRQDPFGGNLTQDQVDGMNYLLTMWEKHFAPNNPNDGTMWLAYCLATTFHETGTKMRPVPENNGVPYGNPPGKYWTPTGPHNQVYHGRGHVQLTWEDNYIKGEGILKDKYGIVDAALHQYPDQMLDHDEKSALVLFDGSVYGWFTGASLQQFFSKAKGIENPYDARTVINAHDKAETIEGYYWAFKKALS